MNYLKINRLLFFIFVDANQRSIALLLNEYRFFFGVDFNEERFRRDLVDLIKTAFRLDFFTLLFLLRRDFRPLLDLGRAAANFNSSLATDDIVDGFAMTA
ncbi:hypothetical protein T11_11637 [Trichinella zimbabwensis]|uniref:Uncharacterized protein n=1 Tax=Trichinella zimbabwensis TaxID=268475 RepID=A0A0V1GV45_9BILA|nr:hypothetical protein T11_11637 [Trichinella zimbabwensis]